MLSKISPKMIDGRIVTKIAGSTAGADPEGVITSIVISNPGPPIGGFSGTPTVTINGDGVGASASAVMTGSSAPYNLSGIRVDAGGANYTWADVTLSLNGSSSFTITAYIDGVAAPHSGSGGSGGSGGTGPTGPTGPVGPTGPAGSGSGGSGSTGPVGPTGPQGAQGAQGPTGPQGATGAAGSVSTGSNAVGSYAAMTSYVSPSYGQAVDLSQCQMLGSGIFNQSATNTLSGSWVSRGVSGVSSAGDYFILAQRVA